MCITFQFYFPGRKINTYKRMLHKVCEKQNEKIILFWLKRFEIHVAFFTLSTGAINFLKNPSIYNFHGLQFRPLSTEAAEAEHSSQWFPTWWTGCRPTLPQLLLCLCGAAVTTAGQQGEQCNRGPQGWTKVLSKLLLVVFSLYITKVKTYGNKAHID